MLIIMGKNIQNSNYSKFTIKLTLHCTGYLLCYKTTLSFAHSIEYMGLIKCNALVYGVATQ